jgi:hypothetical protein
MPEADPQRIRRAVLAGAPGLALAAIGLTHPHHLDAASADWWCAMHIALAFVFPLLGAVTWVLVGPAPDVVRWLGRIASFGYAVLYGALDAMAGIGAGAMAKVQGGRTPLLDPLFTTGNDLGYVGAWFFLSAVVAAVAATAVRARWRVAPGAVLAVAGGIVFLDSHIYWPSGVLAMLALAFGLGQLAWVGSATARAADPVTAPG